MDTYLLKVAGLLRELPKIQISDDLTIASFVLLGDEELTVAAAAELKDKLPECDYLMTAEAKGIPLCAELARQLGHARYIVARKSHKSYMRAPLDVSVNSITTAAEQLLCLDGVDAKLIKGKRVVLVDDVISTGASLEAIEDLARAADATVVGRAAILAEGEAASRDDIIYLEELPLF